VTVDAIVMLKWATWVDAPVRGSRPGTEACQWFELKQAHVIDSRSEFESGSLPSESHTVWRQRK
jgi:hypothetical protein